MPTPRIISGTKGLAAALLGAAWLHASPALAAPLNLTQQFPDLQVSDLDISYDAGTDSFTATQTSFAWFDYSVDGSSSDIGTGDWTYSLTATVDDSGALGPGSLTIEDKLSNEQLTGNLSAFGYFDDPVGDRDVFEFLFHVTGGALASDYGGIGALGGIIIVTGSDSTFAGGFGSDFTATSFSSDTFAAVPLPAAAWLFGSGLLGLAAAARRRHG